MAELFIKEIIDGQLIEIDQMNVGHLLTMMSEGVTGGSEVIQYLFSKLVRIDGSTISREELKHWTNIRAYLFAQESINRMMQGTGLV